MQPELGSHRRHLTIDLQNIKDANTTTIKNIDPNQQTHETQTPMKH
jgi:hypothetical protein